MSEQDIHQPEKTTAKNKRILALIAFVVGIFLIFLGFVLLFSDPTSGIFVILAGLIVFPPSWKAISGKTKIHISRTFRSILAAILFFMALVISGQSSTSKGSTNALPPSSPISQISTIPTPTSAPKNSPMPTKPLTIEERIKAKIALDKDTKITDLSLEPDMDPVTNKDISNKKAVLISYHMNGTYLDTDWTKKGSWSIDTDIIKDVFPLDDSVNTVIMTAEVPVTTAYGNDEYASLDTVTVTRDTFSKINFAKFQPQNLSEIADHYVENHSIK